MGKQSKANRRGVFRTTNAHRARRLALMLSVLGGGVRCVLANDPLDIGQSAANPTATGESYRDIAEKTFVIAANDIAESLPSPFPLPQRTQTLPGAAAPGRPEQLFPGVLPAVDAAAAEAAGSRSPAGAPSSVATRQLSQDQEAEGDTVWRIPPIRWGGSLGYSFQRTQISDGASATSHGFMATLNTASYIYAPWAATVNGRMGLTTSSSGSSQAAGLAGDPGRNRNTSFVGGTELNVFPASRFPFQIFFDRSDSRMSGALVSNDYVNNRFGFRQSYRTVDGLTHAGLQFDRSSVTSSLGGNDTLTAVSGNYGTEIGIVRNSISGRYSLGERELSGERARLLSLNSTHSASLDNNINITGNINYLDNAIQGRASAGGLGDYQTRFLQLNSFATWMPEFEERDDLPLTISLSGRFMNLSSAYSATTVDSQNMGANLNALYRFSNNFTVGSTFAVNQVRTVGQQGILLTQVGANASYVGNPLTFGNYSYNWNAGGGVVRQASNGAIPASVSTTLQAGHSVSRNFVIGDKQSLLISASQSLSTIQSQDAGNSVSVTHSLAASYGLRWAERFSGTATLSLSDIATQGTNSQRYRMIGANLNGTGQLSPLSSANVNLQFNWSQQHIDVPRDFGFAIGDSIDNRQRMGLLGSASYTHSRFMGVRGLRYNLLFTADTRLRDDRLLGNINGEIEKSRWTINNRIDYRFARLDFRVNAVLNDTGGKKNALLFFQVTRQLGAY